MTRVREMRNNYEHVNKLKHKEEEKTIKRLVLLSVILQVFIRQVIAEENTYGW